MAVFAAPWSGDDWPVAMQSEHGSAPVGMLWLALGRDHITLSIKARSRRDPSSNKQLRRACSDLLCSSPKGLQPFTSARNSLHRFACYLFEGLVAKTEGQIVISFQFMVLIVLVISPLK
jgi:hypothetical protein